MPRWFNRAHRRGAILALGAVLALFVLPLRGSDPGIRAILQDPRVLDAAALERGFAAGEERVPVLVHLVSTPEIDGFSGWGDPIALAEHALRVREIENDLLARVSEPHLSVRRRFDNQACVWAEATVEGLRRLLAEGVVAAIESVYELELHSEQGLGLIDGLGSRFAFPGAGVSIAMCDTGIDYLHPVFGGAVLGGNAKVIGGINLGDPGSEDPIDLQGHGTAMAGVAAGLDPPPDFLPPRFADYIGGTALEAKLYAVKVTRGQTRVAQTAAVAAAWDWCVTHMFLDPENPILVINTSLGGGRFEETCDGFVPALTTAAANAIDAGITIVASSGNDGYCEAIALPGCLSDVISVGSVYDADVLNVGKCIQPGSCTPGTATGRCPDTLWGCEDAATEGDMIACYSNVSERLDVYAPGDKAMTANLYYPDENIAAFREVGGTSAAAAYVTGMVAVLQQASLELTGAYVDPRVMRDLLAAPGRLRTHPQTGDVNPRVRIARSLATIGSVTPCQGIEGVNVLSINGLQGIGEGQKVRVGANGPIRFFLNRPDSGPRGKYVVHLNRDEPSPSTTTVLPFELGVSCFPMLTSDGADPVAVFNNLGRRDELGESTYFGAPIPDPPIAQPAPARTTVFSLPGGDPQNLPPGSVWTLQGIILNPESESGTPVSVTNALLMEVQ